MANIDIDIATATDDELRNSVREMARDLVAFVEEIDTSDLSYLETALERWDMSVRPDPVELTASLFRALTEAGTEEWAAEMLTDHLAFYIDPDLADDPDE